MDWKRLLSLFNSSEWSRDRKKIVAYGGLIVVAGIYFQPAMQRANDINYCVKNETRGDSSSSGRRSKFFDKAVSYCNGAPLHMRVTVDNFPIEVKGLNSQ